MVIPSFFLQSLLIDTESHKDRASDQCPGPVKGQDEKWQLLEAEAKDGM